MFLGELPMSGANLAFCALGGVNIWTFLAFGHDKRQAMRGGSRVPEASLLRWSLLGGTPGAFAGRRMFRHKTRKQPFVGRLKAIAAGQAVACAGMAWMQFG